VRINICFIYRPIKWTAKIVPPTPIGSENCQFVYPRGGRMLGFG
jgi:hypothetical protein